MNDMYFRLNEFTSYQPKYHEVILMDQCFSLHLNRQYLQRVWMCWYNKIRSTSQSLLSIWVSHVWCTRVNTRIWIHSHLHSPNLSLMNQNRHIWKPAIHTLIKRWTNKSQYAQLVAAVRTGQQTTSLTTGQWIRKRSRYPRRKSWSVFLRAGWNIIHVRGIHYVITQFASIIWYLTSTCSGRWKGPASLDVINTSVRGILLVASWKASPISFSLKYTGAQSKRRYPIDSASFCFAIYQLR